jgi:hypothetical protein
MPILARTLETRSTSTKYKKRSTIEEAKKKLRGKINRRARQPHYDVGCPI